MIISQVHVEHSISAKPFKLLNYFKELKID